MSRLETLPSFNSYHKYELPAQHLMPAAPRNAVEHLNQIEQQLFALCYNVEDFLHVPREEQIPDLEPVIWDFLHQVVNLLPRALETQSIEEARVDLYEMLFRTRGTPRFTFGEFVNPGADVPEPVNLFIGDTRVDPAIPVHTVVDSNPYCEAKDFELTLNALSATDLLDYTVEFVPDEVPQPDMDDASGANEVEEAVPPKPARKAKAKAPAKAKAKAPAKGSKGKGKASEVEATEPAEKRAAKGKGKAREEEPAAPAKQQATRGKKPAASAPSKARPPAPAPTRARSARIAARGSSTQPAAPALAAAPPTTAPAAVPAAASAAAPPATAPVAIPPTTAPPASSRPIDTVDLSRSPPDILTRRTPSPPADRPIAGPSRLRAKPANLQRARTRVINPDTGMFVDRDDDHDESEDEQVGQKRGRPVAPEPPMSPKRPRRTLPPNPPKTGPNPPRGQVGHRVVENGVTYTLY
ncbi:hypothetical protein B0H12DRAFT_343346 [Mycena haematopus]|nr:hypothetical protein B0H12DRAFT_343346 [Mycena haematopus]